MHAERDLDEEWRRLRAGAGPELARARGRRFWILTRYEHVKQLLTDGESFSSERGNVIDNLLEGGDSGGGRLLVLSDGPRHRRSQAIVSRAFGAAWLAGVVEQVRRNADQLVTRAVGAGECDFAREVAAPIPQLAACQMMGVPDADRDRLVEMTSSALGKAGAPPTPEDAWTAKNELIAYFALLISEHEGPWLDHTLPEMMMRGTSEGTRMTIEEAAANSYSFLLAGEETTRLALSGAVRVLSERPELWAFVQREGGPPQTFVEEILRWTTPALHVGRTTTREVQVGETVLGPGEIVTGWLPAANRDPAVFAAPDVFDPTRDPNPHLTFGGGIHRCLGSYLARIEIAEVLAAIGRHADAVEVTGPGERIYSTFLSGFSSLPVSFRRRVGRESSSAG